MFKYLKELLLCLIIVLAFPMTSLAATYMYDDLGRLTQVTYDSGQTITYTYDAVGNILSVSNTTAESLWEDREVSVIQNNKKIWTIRFNKAVDFTSAQKTYM